MSQHKNKYLDLLRSEKVSEKELDKILKDAHAEIDKDYNEAKKQYAEEKKAKEAKAKKEDSLEKMRKDLFRLYSLYYTARTEEELKEKDYATFKKEIDFLDLLFSTKAHSDYPLVDYFNYLFD